MLLASIFLERFWAWIPFIFLLSSLIQYTEAQTVQNITVSINTPQIVYTPFLCDAPIPSKDVERCNGGWQVNNLNNATFVSTNGPAPGSVSLVPQMFIQFRASAFYLFTSALSNATANITVSNGQAVAAREFNTSVGVVSILSLQESLTTTVSLTFIVDALPARLDISNIILTTTGDPAASSVFLPTMTLPPTASLPTFIPPSPTASAIGAAASTDDHKLLVAEAVGITLGLSLGLTVIAVLGYLWWRRRRRRRPGPPGHSMSDSESVSVTLPPPPSPWSPMVFSQPQPIKVPPGIQNHRGGGRIPGMGQSSKVQKFFGT